MSLAAESFFVVWAAYREKLVRMQKLKIPVPSETFIFFRMNDVIHA
jgi:hypothetical protein